MRKWHGSVVAVVAVLLLVGLLTNGQTQDGPYFVVDPALPVLQASDHVFQTLAAALAAITAPGVPIEEMAGTTIVLYPGVHLFPSPSDLPALRAPALNIPGLRIVSRDGADRTILQAVAPGVWPYAPGSEILRITAPGVRISDITVTDVSGTVGLVGINVAAADCVVERVVVQGLPGAGINVIRGGDSLTLRDCVSIRNGGAGLVAAGVWDLRINGGRYAQNAVDGITLTNCQRVSITSSEASGNIGNGIGFALLGSSDVSITGCNLSDNANGIGNVALAPINRGLIQGCTVTGNDRLPGIGISLTSLSECTITGNSFSGNATQAINIVASNAVTITQNKVSSPGVAFPTPGISLTGPGITSCTVSENEVTGYEVGIGLLGPVPAPANCVVSNNKIFQTTGDGIRVTASGGSNTFANNQIEWCNGNGIRISAAANDVYAGNQITSCTLDGILVNPPAGSAVAGLVIRDNVVSNSGERGIHLQPLAPLVFNNALLIGNKVLRSDKAGIWVDTALGGIVALRVEGNVVRDNEGDGINSAGVGTLVIQKNEIIGNLGFGLNVTVPTPAGTVARVLSNLVHDNAGGGLALISAGVPALGVVPVVERNSFSGNQNFSSSLTGTWTPFPPTYPAGFSLAANWWGHATGPAGLAGGVGNALLGVPAGSQAAAMPLLPAPVASGLAADSTILNNPQVSTINSFAAAQVKIDRTDTVGAMVVLREVTPRANGWLSTAAYNLDWLNNLSPLPGTPIRAIAVMAAGFDTGVAELSVSYANTASGDLSAEDLAVYVCQGGQWVFDEEALEWELVGCSWAAVSSCPVPGSSMLTFELPVEQLTGEIKAIGLFAKGTE